MDAATTRACAAGLISWRRGLGEQIELVLRERRPKVPIESETLADVFMSVLQGAFIFSRATPDNAIIARHLEHFRNYLQLLFEP